MVVIRRRGRGFTLVEIMIVVAIIALLLTIAVPNFLKNRTISRDVVCTNNMKQIASGLEQVCIEENLDATNGGAGFAAGAILWNAAPATGTWGLVAATGYLKTIPTCPIGAGAGYMAGSTPVGKIQITCPNGAAGRGHGAAFVAAQSFSL
ncbi:MAG: prepilin-type N-terminal cleavage/methylation domain-containing protein [bacterium]|nr:prepilin-type N-terminal cleavage/methylation domain-containing protein [bacterium]